MVKNTISLDTNVIIRFLQQDHPDHFSKAKEIFQTAESGKSVIYFDELIVAETIWLLTTHYEQSKDKVANALSQLLSAPWAKNPRKKLILASLNLYTTSNLSYIDCWLYHVSNKLKLKLVTFDKDLQKQSFK